MTLHMSEDMDTPIAESFCSASFPKLRNGERVEVRQRDKGLRGSWYPASIVGLKSGRCIVEYAELLSDDGLCKLRESIPLTKSLLKSSSPTAMQFPFGNTPSSSSMPTPPKKSGLLRPTPPVRTDPPPLAWKGGLFVDVYSQDAWLDAVLLDDDVTMDANAYVNVMYLYKGDFARVPVKNVRISQLWDEVTGEWVIKGSCNVSKCLSRRSIAGKETMQSTSTNPDDLHQIHYLQSKLKLNNGASSFATLGLPGGNAARGLLLEARAALCEEDCNGNSDQLSNLDQLVHEACISQEHLQSSLSEAGKVDNLYSTHQPKYLQENTGCLRRSPCKGFESLDCIISGVPSSVGIESNEGRQAVQVSIAVQHCTEEFYDPEARVGIETGRLPVSDQCCDQTCIGQKSLQSSLSKSDRVDNTSSTKEFSEAKSKAGFGIVGLPSSRQFDDQTHVSQDHLQLILSETGRVDHTSPTPQPDSLLEDTKCANRNVSEGVGCSQWLSNEGKSCADSEGVKDKGKAGYESNVTQQCSQTLNEADCLKKVGRSNLGQLGDANVIHQEPIQPTLSEAIPFSSLPAKLLENVDCLHKSAREGSGRLKCSKKQCGDVTDNERAGNESPSLKGNSNFFSEAVAKVGLETVGCSNSGQFGTKNGISQEPLQSTPLDVSRIGDASCISLESTPLGSGTVDDTSCTLLPDELLEYTGCLHESAWKDSGSLNCSEVSANACSDDKKVGNKRNVMQLCSGTVSKPEETFKLETVELSASHERLNSEEPSQLTCLENSRVVTSSIFLASNATMARGSPRRIESVGYEGPQCVKRNKQPSTVIAFYQGNREGVCKVHASKPILPKKEGSIVSFFRKVLPEDSVETSLETGKVNDSVGSQKSHPEIRKSPCQKEGDSVAFPVSSSSNNVEGEGEGRLHVKQVRMLNGLANPHLPVGPKSSTVLSLLPTHHPPEELAARIRKAERGKSSSTGGRHVDNKGGFDSKKSAEEVNMSFKEKNTKFLSPTYLAKSNAQGQADSMSESKHDEQGCSVGQFDSRGSASPLSTPSLTGSQQTEGSDKLDYLEERSVNRLSKYSCDRPKRHGRNVDFIGSNDGSSCLTSGSRKETAAVKTQEAQATVGCRMKRKATDEFQERVARTGLRDRRCNRGRLFEGKTERRFENETLMSFRDRLVLQKQAETKTMESRKGSDYRAKNESKDAIFTNQGEKNGKQVALFSKQGEKKGKQVAIFSTKGVKDGKKVDMHSKQNTTEKSMFSLTSSIVKDQSLKLLTRDIAKKALVEAGFSIELRPRRSRDYQDSVYVSPDGHAYWSLPKAWQALKKLQVEQSVQTRMIDTHETSSMSGGKGLPNDDRNVVKEVLSRFGDDERLQSALTKRGTSSGANLEMAQNTSRQADVTNADLTDILLEDLGVLRRFTQKFLSQQKSKLNQSTDSLTPRLAEADIFNERRGVKRKQGSGSASEKFKRKMLDGRGSTKRTQGACFSSSNKDMKQETKRSLKQTMVETKATVVKHKDKKGEKPKARSGFRLEVRQSNSSGSEEPACHSTRTVFAWMIDRGAVLEREKIFFLDKENHQAVKEGIVTREGILCSCCKSVFTVDSFEAHAGSKAGDWHQALVFTSGKRLLDRQHKAWDAEIHLRKAHNYVGISEEDTNDDSCLLCGDGGDLICCDGCPSTFHAACLQIDNVPDGDWYCPKCTCGSCGCRLHGEEDDLPVILCNQCEHRYHIACLHGCHSFSGKEVFCRSSCEQIFSSLRGLVGISHSLPGGFSWTLLRCTEEDSIREPTQNTQIDCHSKLAVALLVIKECFNPMVDPRTNVDMITHAMYNRWSEFDRLNYTGFYTAVLEKEGEIICVATIRVHGARLAEMPLIGTREKYRRQGMCRLLVGIIEKLLSSLEVALFILPAIPELFDTWTLAFGFKPLDSSLKLAFRDISMMVFPGTELLQKPVSLSPLEDSLLLHDANAES